MTTVPANDVRIPTAVREALARHEPVMVLSHGRPAFLIVSPDAYEGRGRPRATPNVGRPLREALEILAAAPRPDPDFAADLEAVRASVGPLPDDPWERS
jgi:PHD/YefM family antitoxin component YafN of YafNO toxin-antitoxin module